MVRRIRPEYRKRSAFSLVELVVVLAVLAILAGLAVPMLSNSIDYAAEQATRESLRQLQSAILDRYRIDMAGVVTTTHSLVHAGLPGPNGAALVPATRVQHPQLLYLFVNPTTNLMQSSFNPVTGRGWRGPYLTPGRSGRYPGADAATAAARGFTSQFGEPGDETILDGWNHPIVVRMGTVGPELASAGPDGDLNTSTDNLASPLQ